MQAFLVSLGAVALAEIGDKTQLLSLALAAKYRRPLPICLAILVATLTNHAIAAEIGAWLDHWLTPSVQPWLIGGSSISVSIWALFPDKAGDNVAARDGRGVFIATVIAFFLAEMGDRTQIATAILGAQFRAPFQVIAGTTLGMMIANVPVVLLGTRFARKLPLRAARICAAIIFAALGVWILLR